MTKAPDAFRTISEVAEELDLPQHVLRFWETRFSQIKPMKRGGGRRYYRPDDVSLLRGIKYLLYSEGYTIKGVQRILKELGVRAVQMEEGQEAPSLSEETLSADKVETALEPSKEDLKKQQATPVSEKSEVEKSATVIDGDETSPKEPVTPSDKEVENRPQQLENPPSQLVSAFQIPEELVSVKSPEVQEDETVSQAPPFALTHSVPDHLVNAITAKHSLVETVELPDEEQDNQSTSPLVAPNDILLDDREDEPVKKKPKGIFSRFANDDGDSRQGAGSNIKIDNQDAALLQGTLVDLLECKRLLDQIR